MQGVSFIGVEEKNDDFSWELNDVKIVNKYKTELHEINVYELKRGNGFTIEGGPIEESLKTYFIMSGKCRNIETGRILEPGDLVVVEMPEEEVNIEILEDAKIMIQLFKTSSFYGTKEHIDAVVELLEQVQAKDGYTYQHSKNVYELAKKLAVKLGYRGMKFYRLLRAALYHDVGKVYVEDCILNKPAKLTSEEYATMKKHVDFAEEIMVDNFGEEIYKIISQHHERVDGSGYPLGLRAEEISEEGRILAICDSFDAMVTDRIYKKAFNKEEALEELKSNAGKLYDPRLVEVFLEVVEEEELN